MAKDKPAKYWQFKLDTRRKFTELSQEIARINSGSGADIDLTDYATKVWVEAKGYITASALIPYALKTDIPSLVGYATEDFVNSKLGDYATKDYVNNKLTNYATIDSVTAIQNTLTGQIGAVNASVEQLAATKLDSSYFTLANIKSTLGISDWALSATKPSYTASEVGATPSLGNVGANSVKGNGLGYTYATSAHGGHTAGGFISFGNTLYGCQLNGSIYGNELAFRGLNNGTFTSWKTLAFASDIPTKLSQLTDDVVAGNYLSTQGGTVNGNIKASGNINATSITINGVTITASNGYITVNGNVFATGAITAKAVG